MIEDPLAEEIIKAHLQEGDTIQVDMNKAGDELDIKIKKGSKVIY